MKKEQGQLRADIVTINNKPFSKNERVILLQNDPMFNVKNEEIGIIKSIDHDILSMEMSSGIKKDRHRRI